MIGPFLVIPITHQSVWIWMQSDVSDWFWRLNARYSSVFKHSSKESFLSPK
jgi:hypothetical protein